MISCFISDFNAARSTVGVTFVLVCVEDVCCWSLEKEPTAEIFELPEIRDPELEVGIDLVCERVGNSC